jgi:hypothetical protein
MLKYGSLSSISNSNSKSLIPRNLTYRQQDLFKTTIPDAAIIAAFNTPGNNASLDNLNNLNVANATIGTAKVGTLYVDLIRLKTISKQHITVNDPVLITDLTNVTEQTYGYLIKENAVFQSTRLDINVGNVKFRDNVIQINSSYFTNFGSPVASNKTKYDSLLSGFIFPNTNDDFEKKKFNSMLVIPNKYYLDDVTAEFKQYDNVYTDCFGSNNNEFTNSVRFTSTNYDFSKNSTYLNPKNQLNENDSDLFSINDCTNLLNIEANNLALYGGKIISINSKSFNPDISDSGIGAIEFLIYNNHIEPVQISKFSEDLITFISPVQMENELNLLSNIRFDDIAQIKIKDASAFSIIDFSNNILWTIDGSGNNVVDQSGNFIFPNSNAAIIFENNLNLTSLANQLIDINPLITYNVQNCSELKYLVNIQVNAFDISSSIFFRNVLLDASQNNTFSGKIISKDENGKIMSMTFQGYTMWDSSLNVVTYFTNQMISPNPQWTIVAMEIVDSFDLRVTLSNPQDTTTSWNISMETISI